MNALEMKVLQLYDAARVEGEQAPTQVAVGRALNVPAAEMRTVFASLRESSYLEGKGLLSITPEGVTALEAAVRDGVEEDTVEEDTQADHEPEPDLADANADAAMGAAPATSSQPQREHLGDAASTALAKPSASQTAAVLRKSDQGARLSELIAQQMHVDPRQVYEIIKTNVISLANNDTNPITNEEVLYVMSVMNTYNLDPNIQEIHAFRSQGKLRVMVGHNGRVTMAHRYPGFKGVTYEYPGGIDNMVESPDCKGRKSWPMIIATCESEGQNPTVRPCMFEEWYVPQGSGKPGPWQKYTSHRHMQKAYDLVTAEHCGIVGLMDETDREWMEYNEREAKDMSQPTAAKQGALEQQMADADAEVTDASDTEDDNE